MLNIRRRFPSLKMQEYNQHLLERLPVSDYIKLFHNMLLRMDALIAPFSHLHSQMQLRAYSLSRLRFLLANAAAMTSLMSGND